MPTTAVLKLPAAAIGMPRESGPPGPAQESLLGSEEAAPELNAFEAFRAGRKLGMNPADHLGDYLVHFLYGFRKYARAVQVSRFLTEPATADPCRSVRSR